MKIDRKPRLWVEELESRVVPSTVAPPATPPAPYAMWGTSNWSGIDLDTKNGAATAVSASWTVPAVSAADTGTGYSSAWVGIDGDISSTVEQIGTESDTAATSKHDGTPQYYAWYEMYPSDSFTITKTNSGAPFTVSPGDVVSASVNYVNSTTSGRHTYENFLLTITDTPISGAATETYSTTQSISGAEMSSAEWIQEAPSGSSVLPLSNFGSITFTGAQATISGATGTIASFVGNPSVVNYGTAAKPLEINLMDIGTFNRAGQWTSIEDETSLLTGGNSFTVQFGSSSTGPGGTALYGPADRLTNPTDFQATAASAGTPLGLDAVPTVVEISPATLGAASPLNPVLPNESVAQPRSRFLIIQGEGDLGRSDSFSAPMAQAEGYSGAVSPGFGPAPVSDPADPFALTPLLDEAMGEDGLSTWSAEPFGVAIQQAALEFPPALAFIDDTSVDHLVGALAMVAFLPSLKMPKTKEETARAGRLPAKNGRRV